MRAHTNSYLVFILVASHSHALRFHRSGQGIKALTEAEKLEKSQTVYSDEFVDYIKGGKREQLYGYEVCMLAGILQVTLRDMPADLTSSSDSPGQAWAGGKTGGGSKGKVIDVEKFLRPNAEIEKIQVEGAKAEIEKNMAETKTQNQVLVVKLSNNLDMRDEKMAVCLQEGKPIPAWLQKQRDSCEAQLSEL